VNKSISKRAVSVTIGYLLPQTGEHAMSDIDPSVSEYMRKIGSLGGKKGGKISGPQKARSPDHYRKMVDARNAQRAAKKAIAQLSD